MTGFETTFEDLVIEDNPDADGGSPKKAYEPDFEPYESDEEEKEESVSKFNSFRGDH